MELGSPLHSKVQLPNQQFRYHLMELGSPFPCELFGGTKTVVHCWSSYKRLAEVKKQNPMAILLRSWLNSTKHLVLLSHLNRIDIGIYHQTSYALVPKQVTQQYESSKYAYQERGVHFTIIKLPMPLSTSSCFKPPASQLPRQASWNSYQQYPSSLPTSNDTASEHIMETSKGHWYNQWYRSTPINNNSSQPIISVSNGHR